MAFLANMGSNIPKFAKIVKYYVGMLRMIRETGILSFFNSLRALIGYIIVNFAHI